MQRRKHFFLSWKTFADLNWFLTIYVTKRFKIYNFSVRKHENICQFSKNTQNSIQVPEDFFKKSGIIYTEQEIHLLKDKNKTNAKMIKTKTSDRNLKNDKQLLWHEGEKKIKNYIRKEIGY